MYTHENHSVPELSLEAERSGASSPQPTHDTTAETTCANDTYPAAVLPSVILKQECSRSQSPEGYALERRIALEVQQLPPGATPLFASHMTAALSRCHVGSMQTRQAKACSTPPGPNSRQWPNPDSESPPPVASARSSIAQSRISSYIHTPQIIEGWSVTTPSEAYYSPLPLDSLTEHLRLYETATATMDSPDTNGLTPVNSLLASLPDQIHSDLHNNDQSSPVQRLFFAALLWQKWPEFAPQPYHAQSVCLIKKGLLDQLTAQIGSVASLHGDDLTGAYNALDADLLLPEPLNQSELFDNHLRLKPGYTDDDFDAIPREFLTALQGWQLVSLDCPVLIRYYVSNEDTEQPNVSLELYPPVYSLHQLRQKRILDESRHTPTIQLSNIDLNYLLESEIQSALDTDREVRVYAAEDALEGPLDLASFRAARKRRIISPITPDQVSPHLVVSVREPRGFIEDTPVSAGTVMGTTGLNNLGNTCYMNSALQCLVHVPEVVEYFLSGHYESEINRDNPIGKNGDVALAFAELVRRLYLDKSSSYAPRQFKSIVGEYGPQFAGYGQQDSQEFLAYLLDSLHEDLNRVLKKPATTKPELDPTLASDPLEVTRVAVESWDVHRLRNDSPILDLFTGMYKSTVVCPVSEQASITFDPFSDLTLPLPVDDTWTYDFLYVPYEVSIEPYMIRIELKKHSRFQELRQVVASKAGDNVSPSSLMFSEVYMCQFFRHIRSDENGSVSELIPANDNIIVFETGMSADEMWSYQHDSEPKKFIVPVFHRLLKGESEQEVPAYRRQTTFLSMPFFVTLTDAEAKSLEEVQMKVCRKYLQVAKDSERWTSLTEFPFGLNFATSRTNDIPMGGLSILNDDRIFDMTSRLDASETPSPDTIEVDGELNTPEKEDDEAVIVSEEDANMESETGGWEDEKKEKEEEDKEDNLHKSTEEGETDSVLENESDAGVNDKDMSNDADEETTDAPSCLPPPPPFDRRASLPSPPVPTNFITHSEGIVCDWTADGAAEFISEHSQLVEQAETISDPALDAARAARSARAHKGIELSECLDLFSAPEVLSDDDLWYCPVCKDFRQATKKIELWKCPEILVIHLKRFSSSRNFRDKISEVVNFPIEGLDLTDRVGEALNDQNPLIYDLIAVDNHMGGLGGGHYTAYAKNFVDSKWYHYNDSNVSPVSPENIVSSNAYLLFYKRRGGDGAVSGTTKTHEVLRDLVTKRAENDLTVYSSFVATAEGKMIGGTRSSGGGSLSAGSSSYSSGSHVSNRLKLRNDLATPQSPLGNPPAYAGPGSVLGPSPQSSADSNESHSSVGTGIPWEAASLTLSSSDEDNLASDLPTPGDSDMHSSVHSQWPEEFKENKVEEEEVDIDAI